MVPQMVATRLLYNESVQIQIAHELVYRASSVLLLVSAGIDMFAMLNANVKKNNGSKVFNCLQFWKYKWKCANGDVRGASGRPSGPHESECPTSSVLQFASAENDEFAISRADIGHRNDQMIDIA